MMKRFSPFIAVLLALTAVILLTSCDLPGRRNSGSANDQPTTASPANLPTMVIIPSQTETQVALSTPTPSAPAEPIQATSTSSSAGLAPELDQPASELDQALNDLIKTLDSSDTLGDFK